MARLLSILGLTAVLLSGCSVPDHVATMMSGGTKDSGTVSLRPTSQLIDMADEARGKTQPPPI